MRKVMIGIALLAFAVTASAHLLVNPSFEVQGSESWLADSWWRTTGPDLADRVNWWPNSGSYHMSFNDWQGGSGSFGQWVGQSFDEGDVFTFSIWGDAGTLFDAEDVRIGIEIHRDGEPVIYDYVSILAGLQSVAGSGYHQYTHVTTATVENITGVSAYVQVLNRDTGSPNHQLFFDDAYLAIPEPTAVVLMGLGGLMACMLRRKTSK
jgi:hypothetical protein